MPIYERKTTDIYISDAIRKVLEGFNYQSPIANTLLYKRINREVLKDSGINYIGISAKDPTKISYLTPERIAAIEKSSTDDYWTSPKRYECKPGKFVGKMFSGFKPKEVENFANLFESFSFQKEFTFEVVKGDRIKSLYSHESHFRHTGSLGESCMKYDSCQTYFDLYTNNDSVSLLAMLAPNGLVLGRALLWESGDNKIMDRIYTVDDSDYTGYFIKYAVDNGYTYKLEQSCGNTLQLSDGHKKFEKKLSIKLNIAEFDEYPYLDTFKWLDVDNKKIYNYLPEHFAMWKKSHRVISIATGGHESADTLAFDDIDKRYNRRAEMTKVKTKKGDVFTLKCNCEYSETLDCFILEAEAKQVAELEDDYIYKDDSRNDKKLIEKRMKTILAKRGDSGLLAKIKNTIFG